MKEEFFAEFDNEELEDLVKYCGGDTTKVIKWWNEKYSAPNTLEELINYPKRETIDWCNFDSELDFWRHCLYTYEKGLSTSLEDSINMFCEEYLDEDEYKEVWDEENDQYIFNKLEEKMNKYCPGIVDFLIGNKVSEIIYTW